MREPSAKYLVRPGSKQTALGVIPLDWDVVPMGQVSECLIGLTYSPFDVCDFGTLVLRSSNIQNGKLAFDDNVFVDMDVPTRAITRKNDILICVRNGSRQLIGKLRQLANWFRFQLVETLKKTAFRPIRMTFSNTRFSQIRCRVKVYMGFQIFPNMRGKA